MYSIISIFIAFFTILQGEYASSRSPVRANVSKLHLIIANLRMDLHAKKGSLKCLPPPPHSLKLLEILKKPNSTVNLSITFFTFNCNGTNEGE